MSKKHDTAATPFHRAIGHPTVAVQHKVALAQNSSLINPAATQRQVQALAAQLLKLATSRADPVSQAQVNKRAS
ncbi:hypothetical protein [Mycolicibacterium confluentis]|uniref:Uncharacterized protein n=1 Tax=Mycolicibacterium confluentis TaxID=28047 RepID=A0A7I7XS89_9MYCO|nr:hypothetical protein [Mycolicibacterium confluentis]MCV7321435.1 hypothetical protein [Mycolicibacterium confluentis]BBZ32081.1 hypothetical protein MCNF_06860 [Mycolicibacterium confluentis]